MRDQVYEMLVQCCECDGLDGIDWHSIPVVGIDYPDTKNPIRKVIMYLVTIVTKAGWSFTTEVKANDPHMAYRMARRKMVSLIG